MKSILPRRELVRATLLTVVALGIWLLAQGGSIDWRTPPSYSVDSLETLLRFRLSAERGLGMIFDPGAPRLGAPWGADWSAYPLPDALWYWGIGRLVNWFGLIPASYLALALAHVTAALSFYLCARTLRHRVPFAAAGALVFGFCFSIFERGLSHHSFALAFAVPPALLCAWLVGGSRQLLGRRRWFLGCVGAAAVVGAGNPYLVFLFFQLLGFALLYQWFTARRRANLQAGLAAFGAALVMFALTNFPALWQMATAGSEHLARNYAASEIYALKLIELGIPPPAHRWQSAAELGRLYASSTALRGELFTSYAGIVGVLAAIATLTVGFFALWRGRRVLRPSHAPIFVWILIFSMAGGLNSILSLAGFDLFRAGNRYSIHLLAVGLFFLSAWATRRARRWPAAAAWAVVVPVVTLAMWDQMPHAPDDALRTALREQAEKDQRTVAALETALPQGAMIFQLPAVPFPEAGPRLQMSDYEHARLYLHSSDLRFSYGSVRDTAALRWAEWAASLPAAKLIDELERAGFQAILLDRRAYAHRGQELIDAFTRAGYATVTLRENADLELVSLRPADQPRLPDLNAVRLYPRWTAGGSPNDAITAHALRGWFPAERADQRHWRWVTNDAELGLWNNLPNAVAARLTAEIRVTRPGTLELRRAGASIWRQAITDRATLYLALELPTGSSHLTWHFNGRPVRIAGDPRRLGFAVENLSVVPVR